MKRTLIRRFLLLRLACLSRAAANALIRREADQSLALLAGLSEEEAGRPVRVPPMLGVDEEMRNWSLYQVLEHNAIVNRAFTRIILCLVRGQPITAPGDPKKDVLPSDRPGAKAVADFQTSVERHLEKVAQAGKLRGTAKHPHPVCGPLDAHGWHGFLGLHLGLHRAQMEAIRRELG